MKNFRDVFEYAKEVLLYIFNYIKNSLIYIDKRSLYYEGHFKIFMRPFENLCSSFFEGAVDFVDNIYLGTKIVIEALGSYLNASLEAKLVKIEKLVLFFGTALEAFTVRWSLRWYLFFVRYLVYALICIAIGFGIGTVLTILLYDDGTERVMDVYNYFKNPPRR